MLQMIAHQGTNSLVAVQKVYAILVCSVQASLAAHLEARPSLLDFL